MNIKNEIFITNNNPHRKNKLGSCVIPHVRIWSLWSFVDFLLVAFFHGRVSCQCEQVVAQSESWNVGKFIRCVTKEPCIHLKAKRLTCSKTLPHLDLPPLTVQSEQHFNKNKWSVRTDCQRSKRNNLTEEHVATDLRSALRHTVRAKCKAALLFPPDCDTQWISVSVTGTSWTQKNSYRCTCELTGKMKLVSGGSSAVNLSIQVSRSAIGAAVNFVLSYKKQNREKINPKHLESTQDTIFHCITPAGKCVLVWLSLAVDRGVAMLEPTSCKMHCIYDEKSKNNVKNLLSGWCKMSAMTEVNKCNVKFKPCPADLWTCVLCPRKTPWPSCNVHFNKVTSGGEDYKTS